jgi:hypothetical protein
LQARRFEWGKEEVARVRRFEGAEENKKKKLEEEEEEEV